MVIKQVQNIIRMYKAANPPKVEKGQENKGLKLTGGQDEFTLSDEFREYKMVREAYEKAPVVREEKVAKLRDQISQGTYKIDSGQVAEKILDRQTLAKLV